MNLGKALSIAMIVLSLIASVGYLLAHDYRRSLYWLCSAGLISAVTF